MSDIAAEFLRREADDAADREHTNYLRNGGREMTTSDRQLNLQCKLIASLRAKGVSIRVIARTFGMSKSTLHRYLPAFEAIAAENACVPNGTGAGGDGAQQADA